MPQHAPRPRRRIAAALLLGLATTVAVAWAALVTTPAVYADGYARETTVPVWTVTARRSWGRSDATYWHLQVSGYSLTIQDSDFEADRLDLDRLPAALRPGSLADLHMLASYTTVGWPMRALVGESHWGTQVASVVTWRHRWSIPLPDAANGNPRGLPYRPLWAGLAVNTALYAATWWLAFGLVARARVARRRRRGLCPRCAYDLAGLASCPECGWATAPPTPPPAPPRDA